MGQAPHPFRQGRVWAPGQLGPAAHDDPEDGVWSELMLELAEQVLDDVRDGAVVHGAGSGVCSDHRLGCPSRTGLWFRRGVRTLVGWLRAEWVEQVEHERHGWLPGGGHQGSGPQRRLRETRRERRSPAGGLLSSIVRLPPLRPSPPIRMVSPRMGGPTRAARPSQKRACTVAAPDPGPGVRRLRRMGSDPQPVRRAGTGRLESAEEHQVPARSGRVGCFSLTIR